MYGPNRPRKLGKKTENAEVSDHRYVEWRYIYHINVPDVKSEDASPPPQKKVKQGCVVQTNISSS